MSDEDREFYLSELDKETEEIKKSFSSLFFNLQKHIENTQKLKDVVVLLTSYNTKLFGNMFQSFADIFEHISRLSSFFDYALVEHLAKELGSRDIKRKLKEYKKTFREFSKHRVCQCPSDAFGDINPSEKVYKLVIDESIGALTVTEIEKLRYEMNAILGQKLLRLLHVNRSNSVELVFRTFATDYETISLKQQQALRSIGVLSISYGDHFSMVTCNLEDINTRDELGEIY